MKRSLLTLAPRFRAALALALMLALLPVGSIWNTAQAKPPKHAPAYGYRRKVQTKRVYRRYQRPVIRRTWSQQRRYSRTRPGYRKYTYKTYHRTRTYRRY